MKLEKMDTFFAACLNGYDLHMMTEIEGAEDFYPYTAALLPMEHGANVLEIILQTLIQSRGKIETCAFAVYAAAWGVK